MTNSSESSSRRFSNKRFETVLKRTPAGSIWIQVRPSVLKSHYDNHRQIAACIYEIAAELERRSDEFNAPWAVSPEPFNFRVLLELCEGTDVDHATRFVTSTLSDMGLA